MINEVGSESKNIYLKINIFILTAFINQTLTLPFRPLNYKANQWYGFYTLAKLDWNKLSFFLILNTTFSLYIFSFREESLLPFPWVSSLTIYFSQKHNNKNANWKFPKQIARNNTAFVNTNQIKLKNYSDFLKENNLNLKVCY